MNDLVEVRPNEIIPTKSKDNLFSVFNNFRKKQYEFILSELKKLPSIINLYQSMNPEHYLVANLTEEQKKMTSEGLLKLMKDKDGNLLAVLTKNGKIHNQIPLKDISMTPNLNGAVNNFIIQQQMAQIIGMINQVQQSVDRVIAGQQDDRIGLCNSAEQQLINARRIKNEDIRLLCLVNAIQSAEDSRNMIMLALKRDINFIENLSSTSFGMFKEKVKTEDINRRMQDIALEFSVLTRTSLVEAATYYELNETEAMLQSVTYYANFIKETLPKETILKLNSNAGETVKLNYWVNRIPETEAKLSKMIEHLNDKYLQIDNSLAEEKNILLIPEVI